MSCQRRASRQHLWNSGYFKHYTFGFHYRHPILRTFTASHPGFSGLRLSVYGEDLYPYLTASSHVSQEQHELPRSGCWLSSLAPLPVIHIRHMQYNFLVCLSFQPSTLHSSILTLLALTFDIPSAFGRFFLGELRLCISIPSHQYVHMWYELQQIHNQYPPVGFTAVIPSWYLAGTSAA